MEFTKNLFEKTAMALPGMTAREFSRYCGKSEGYYGSIISQNLNISTNALMYLAEVLHYKNEISPSRGIGDVLEIISQEIATRTRQFQCENEAVRKMVLRAVASAYLQRDDGYYAPAIVIG
jgi:transcriptional regulator with XRE-family HTH domain